MRSSVAVTAAANAEDVAAIMWHYSPLSCSSTFISSSSSLAFPGRVQAPFTVTSSQDPTPPTTLRPVIHT
ncbi:hypothetical protein AcW1_008754 [Taiwanofungus camphoratus]|nr:hypothetical protein AcW1_008754 [Antrodia cinnamomea]